MGFIKAFLDQLPFGVVIVEEEDNELKLLWNRTLGDRFTKDEIESEIARFEGMDLEISVNKAIVFSSVEGILRKELVRAMDKEFKAYFFFHASNHEFFIIDNQVEHFFKDILELVYDGVVYVDSDGYVKVLTEAFAELLGVDAEESIGKHVTEVIENTRMHIVAKNGKTELAEPHKIKNKYIISTRIPVFKNGKVVGAVGKVLFNNMEQISALSKRLKIFTESLNNNKGNLLDRNMAYYTFDSIMGVSATIEKAKKYARKAAKSDSTVLIIGESGTGKELFAHSIHNESDRSMGAFVKVNCAAIPLELLESELFGYEEGSFTGANKGGKVGKFEIADGGTIFLDEIGEFPIHMQVKLLRVLQEREIERIGGLGSKPINVRVIIATNRNLEEMVENSEFRLDLYYRIKVMQLNVPSLRERSEDIELLAKHFLDKYQQLMNKNIQGISSEAVHYLQNYSWPGNIRELENTIERALNLLEDGEVLTPKHLPRNIANSKPPSSIIPLAEVLEDVERKTIVEALQALDGNKSEAARKLGISRTSLYEKMNKFGL